MHGDTGGLIVVMLLALVHGTFNNKKRFPTDPCFGT